MSIHGIGRISTPSTLGFCLMAFSALGLRIIKKYDMISNNAMNVLLVTNLNKIFN